MHDDLMFIENLARCLAHTLWFEEVAPLLADGLPTYTFRADMSPNIESRDPGADAETLYKLQRQYGPGAAGQQQRTTEQFLLGNPAEGTRGLLDIYAKDVAPTFAGADRAASTASREADLADVARLGRGAVEAFQAANPQQQKLLGELNTQVSDDLGAGYGFGAPERRLIRESVLGGQQDRGFGTGDPSDVYAQAMAESGYGVQRHQQRLDNAGRLVGINQAASGDPFQLVTGRSSGAGGVGLLNTANANSTGINDQIFGMGKDVLDYNANAQATQAISKANNNAALAGAGISAAGSVGSSL